MRTEIILNWEYGNPTQDGLYYVAVKHGESAGFLEFVQWQNQQWLLPSGGEVVAHIGLESLNRQLDIQWPLPPSKNTPSPQAQDGEIFEEV